MVAIGGAGTSAALRHGWATGGWSEACLGRHEVHLAALFAQRKISVSRG